jgi:hypothetical protein
MSREISGSFLDWPHAEHLSSSWPWRVSNLGSNGRSCVPVLTGVVFQSSYHGRPHTITTPTEEPSVCSDLRRLLSANQLCTTLSQHSLALEIRYWYTDITSLRYLMVAWSASRYQPRVMTGQVLR